MSDNSYDVTIIGGGCVGLATAYKINQKYPSLKIAVLEKEKIALSVAESKRKGAEEKALVRESNAAEVADMKEKAAIEKENTAKYEGDDAEIVTKIIDLINTYVKPAVEMDGGNIEFKSYNAGIVTVELQGACSGCPSSTVTLKNGIETMLKDMLPNQINEVVAING